MKRVGRWMVAHPLVVSLAAIVLVAGPGYYRLEKAINEAHQAAVDAGKAAEDSQETANRVDELFADFRADVQDRRMLLCQRDIEDRKDARAMWIYVTEVVLVPPTEQVSQARRALDEILPVLACTSDAVPVPAGD